MAELRSPLDVAREWSHRAGVALVGVPVGALVGALVGATPTEVRGAPRTEGTRQ